MKIVLLLPCAVGLLSQATADNMDSHSVGIALLGVSLTVVAFFIKSTLTRIERKLEAIEGRMHKVAVLEDWRKTTDHRLSTLERG